MERVMHFKLNKKKINGLKYLKKLLIQGQSLMNPGFFSCF